MEFLNLDAFALLLIGVSFFTSFLTAIAGIGGGVMLLAVMVTVYPPSIVIPVHGVVQMGSNFFRMGLMRHFIERSIVVPFAIGSCLGAFIGAQFVVALDEVALKFILAMFILYLVWGPPFKRVHLSRRVRFYLSGFITTFASLFVGASGHLNSAFIGREGLRKEGQVASVAACMFCVHVLKTIVFGIVGFVFYDYALLMFLMIVTGFAGTYVGKHMLFKLPEKLFKIIYKTVITLLALRLLVSIF